MTCKKLRVAKIITAKNYTVCKWFRNASVTRAQLNREGCF